MKPSRNIQYSILFGHWPSPRTVLTLSLSSARGGVPGGSPRWALLPWPCCGGVSGKPLPWHCLCSSSSPSTPLAPSDSSRRPEWLSQLQSLPAQDSLKPVTEIGSAVPAGLLAIQQVPRGGPINHICSLLGLAGLEDSRWVHRASVGVCCVRVCLSPGSPGTKFSCNKSELVAACLITVIHPTSSKEVTGPPG